jgi:membrane-associated phospholipid phosphatase
MKIASVALLVVLTLVASPQALAQVRAGEVTRWIEVGLDEIASHGTNPPRASRALALLSVAMLDAARAGERPREATVAAGAATVLAYLYPDRTAVFAELARPYRGDGGFAQGRRIGAQLVESAGQDGSDGVWQGEMPIESGLWLPTPSAFVPGPLEPLAGTWRTWNLAAGSQFRPPPPPAFGGDEYQQEVREVYEVSLSLTDEQKHIAELWADGAGTVTPPGHWNLIALELIRANDLSLRAAARVLAALKTAQADAFIAAWDAKYAYWTERPVTAIQRELEPNWLPYLTTPPFPSYVSGHSATSGAASEILGQVFPEEAPRLAGLAEEAAVSRLYGGIHFRSDNEAGLALGRQVAQAAVAVYGRNREP